MIGLLLLLSINVVFVKLEEQESEQTIIKYTRPLDDGLAYFAEPFHSVDEFEIRWKPSTAKKDGVEESISKYDGKWVVAEPKDNPIVGDNGLIFMSEAKHGAISSPLQNPFKFEDKPLVVQYEVKFQKKHECGGAYIKLLADTNNLKFEEFHDKTEYTIMFGPDKCGGDGKLHFIFQHRNPVTHKMEEKHAKKATGEFSNIFDDGKTHLVGLVVRPDNSFEILVDKVIVNSGSLLKDMEPPINPPKMIDDPNDAKPDEWDEREKIPDPDATKPEDWDEDAPKMIPDPNAVKPDGWLDDEPDLTPDPAAAKPQDWDEEEDGEWEAPQISNPKCKTAGCGDWSPPQIKNPEYKGKWTPPLITNPSYKGIWSAKQIENPNYFEDNNPFTMKPIAAVGFELWSMQSDIVFDNIIITDDVSLVQQWTHQTWDLKHSRELASSPNVSGMLKSFMDTMNEKPWLWVVVVLAVALPIILIYFLCCRKDDKTAITKKTDEVLPDDEENEDEAIQDVDEDVEKEDICKDKSVEDEVVVPQESNEDQIKEEQKSAGEKEELSYEEVEVTENLENSVEDVHIEDIPTTETAKSDLEEANNKEDLLTNSCEKDTSEDVDQVEVDEAGVKNESVPEEIPHSSPKTRAARRKTRKES